MTTTLETLTRPKSIAIVGASDDPARIGGRPLAHMLSQRFEGVVYPVNSKRERVQGLPAYPSLAEIPGDLDFVAIAVPAADVLGVARQAAAKRARTVLIFSSGFAETSAEGAAMQAELAALARHSGMRIIGPNCLGLFNSTARFYPTFSSTIDRATPTPGGLAIASQSGAYGGHIYLAAHLRGLGIGYWITTGNEADLHVAEAIRLLAAEPDVHCILAYAESVKNGPMLIEALETARANRTPVVFMKVGRSEVGARAVASHTASLAGEDAVYDAVLRQYGAHRAHSTEAMLDIAYACRPRLYPVGRRVGVVTISGGGGVVMADAAEDHGLELSPMPQDAQAEMTALAPFAAPRNPVDVTAQFFNDMTLVERFVRLMIDRGGYDGLVGFWTSTAGSPSLAEPLFNSLRSAAAARPDLPFLQCMIAPPEIRARYEAAGFSCFEDPGRAIAALAALVGFGEAFARGGPAARWLARLELPEGPISEYQAARILRRAGLPVLESVLAETAQEAAAAAGAIGGPVAMKLSSPDIPHKTEVGGVALDVQGRAAADAAFRRIERNLDRYAPDARFDGVQVAPMVTGGVECILGARIDPAFGPMVMIGLGGVFAEVLNDVSLRRAPFGPETAREMLAELQGAPVLEGMRGQPGADLNALARAISLLSRFVAAHADRIESVEMNPLLALPDRCLALDAAMLLRG